MLPHLSLVVANGNDCPCPCSWDVTQRGHPPLTWPSQPSETSTIYQYSSNGPSVSIRQCHTARLRQTGLGRAGLHKQAMAGVYGASSASISTKYSLLAAVSLLAPSAQYHSPPLVTLIMCQPSPSHLALTSHNTLAAHVHVHLTLTPSHPQPAGRHPA